MPYRTLFALAAALFILGHMTGVLKSFNNWLDLGVQLRDMPYLLALPGMCVFTLFMLRN